MEQVALDVPTMHSQECERAVTAALINTPGVSWATAASTTGVVGVQYDPRTTDLTELREAVQAASFQSTR